MSIKKEINLMNLAMEIVVGRLVLSLPKKDLKEVNKMILRNIENAEVQEEDNRVNGL